MKNSELVGKRLLVVLNYISEDTQEAIGQKIATGVVENIDENVMRLKLDDDSVFTLPPNTDALVPAKPGVYDCQEFIAENPDFIVIWTVGVPGDHDPNKLVHYTPEQNILSDDLTQIAMADQLAAAVRDILAERGLDADISFNDKTQFEIISRSELTHNEMQEIMEEALEKIKGDNE